MIIVKEHAKLVREQGIPTLFVDGKPFLIMGGELHNSSASSLKYMESRVWPNISDLNLNTVILPITWEQLEKEEGQFDFSLVDGLIKQAESHKLRLVLLWFGLWKNGESHYIPRWMKENPQLYFREENRFGQKLYAISPLCSAAVEKDSYAFSKLMAHIRDYDKNRSIIMVQVENEMGLLGDIRDFCPMAQEQFKMEIPQKLRDLTGLSGSWEKAFGPNAQEAFMCCCYAQATEKIIAKGKGEYPLPMYVNAWLEQHPFMPGKYPCGGPIAKFMNIWKAFCPSADFMAPDIYLPNFDDICTEYSAMENMLFIPEARPCMDSASNVFSALCGHAALGFSPFALDSLCLKPVQQDSEKMAQLNIELSAFDTYRSGEFLKKSYNLLENLMPLILKYRGTPRLRGFTKYKELGVSHSFGPYTFQVDYKAAPGGSPKSGGIILQLNDDEFLIAGYNMQLTVHPSTINEGRVEIISIEETEYENGVLETRRILNGDERYIIHTKDELELYKFTLKAF